MLKFFGFIFFSLAITSLARGATADHAMVVTANPLATDAAVRVLREGGNAIDAAIEAGLMLGVVNGFHSGIGGGCLALIRTADGKFFALDGREMAPAAASRDMYLRAGKADTTLSQTGALAVGIPGTVAMYEFAVEHFGKKHLADLVAPAATLAEEGFAIDADFHKRLAANATDLAKFPASAQIFLHADGTALNVGEILKQPDLAKTYRAISDHGADYFYHGEFAKSVGDWMKRNGGIVTADDFANYKLVQREPLISHYRGDEIIGFPPPSSGGAHVAQILNILSNFDLAAMEKDDPATRVHVMAEAMKRAFADRAFWLGDSDFVPVPRGLLDENYARELASTIDVHHASAHLDHGTPPDAQTNLFGKHTTHIAVADDAGNWVAITQTVNTNFGSKVIVPGTGVILNNQMDDFSIQPGVPNFFGLVGSEANAIAPGKRPLSSMSPTIVLDASGQPFLTVGAAGGPRIISQVLLTISNVIDLHDDLPAAMNRPRFHQQWSPDVLWIENSFGAREIDALKKMGHTLNVAAPEGATQAIEAITVDGRRQFVGVSEPRGGGKAAGE